MDPYEDKDIEYRLLSTMIGHNTTLSEIAEKCVAFANSQGGVFVIGVDDYESEPPIDQQVNIKSADRAIAKLRALTDCVTITNCELKSHPNGGEYFTFRVLPTLHTIAITSNGKIFIRLDGCSTPISGEYLTTLAAEKHAFQWELISTQTHIKTIDPEAINNFTREIKSSSRVADAIKSCDDHEILKRYQLIDDFEMVTNLGVLWLGNPSQRTRICYPLTILYIVYNAHGESVREEYWELHQFTPKELIESVLEQAVELTESTEVEYKSFKKSYRNYPENVVKELLINAIAHRKYTLSGNIYIEIYPDKLTITNPGGLPYGVTSENILHARERRNPHLIKTLRDTNIMSCKGSGYNDIWREMAQQAKAMPAVESDINSFSVTLSPMIMDEEVLAILDHVERNYDLTQRESITFALIAAASKISATDLQRKLQLKPNDKRYNGVNTLILKKLIAAKGVKNDIDYVVNNEVITSSQMNFKSRPKTLSTSQLEGLIYEDVKQNGASSIVEISNRLPEIDIADIQRIAYKLRRKGIFDTKDNFRNKQYVISRRSHVSQES